MVVAVNERWPADASPLLNTHPSRPSFAHALHMYLTRPQKTLTKNLSLDFGLVMTAQIFFFGRIRFDIVK